MLNDAPRFQDPEQSARIVSADFIADRDEQAERDAKHEHTAEVANKLAAEFAKRIKAEIAAGADAFTEHDFADLVLDAVWGALEGEAT